jgi:hypothetical protein
VPDIVSERARGIRRSSVVSVSISLSFSVRMTARAVFATKRGAH